MFLKEGGAHKGQSLGPRELCIDPGLAHLKPGLRGHPARAQFPVAPPQILPC